MTERADRVVEAVADRLGRTAEEAERRPVPDAAAKELREDASFLRQLKPSLIRARIRGATGGGSPPSPGPAAPSGPQIRPGSPAGGGVNALVVVGGAFLLGIVLAKLVDWRSHAHPRR